MKTNRDYFSWSQYSLWKTSKREFIKRYVNGEKQKTIRQFEKGHELAEYIETGLIPHYVNDPLLELVGNSIPKLKHHEEEFRVSLFHELLKKDVELLSYLDSSDGTGDIFYEYKTGKTPWTQELVDKHEQLDFYAAMQYIKYNKIPKCKLYWIETEEVEFEGNKELRYTGKIEEFVREITATDIVHMLSQILTAMFEIEMYSPEDEEIEVGEDFIERYAYLTKLAKETEEELDLMKLKIKTELDANYASIARGKKGWFAISNRANWSYSRDLVTKAKKYKDEITKEQTKEQKSGVAKNNPTQSIRFNLVK